jgi:hypothetical protein
VSERVFPLPMPGSGDDSRFTFGLLVDVRSVLVDHGYPAADMTGLDLVELQHALFRFLYRREDATGGECR